MSAAAEHPAWCDRGRCTVNADGFGSHRGTPVVLASVSGSRTEVFLYRWAADTTVLVTLERYFDDSGTEPEIVLTFRHSEVDLLRRALDRLQEATP